jgi:hypothetical protein
VLGDETQGFIYPRIPSKYTVYTYTLRHSVLEAEVHGLTNEPTYDDGGYRWFKLVGERERERRKNNKRDRVLFLVF